MVKELLEEVALGEQQTFCESEGEAKNGSTEVQSKGVEIVSGSEPPLC
jgi:hypothetical protein